MIEFLSNFYLKSETDDENGATPPVSARAKQFQINATNAEQTVDDVVDAYKQLNDVVVLYESSTDLKFFLSLFAFKYANIRKRTEFEDVLVINRCVLL